MSFKYLEKLQVTKEMTVRFPLLMLEGDPVLILRPATSANKEYFNALLKRNRKNMRQIQAGDFNLGLVEENRDSDRTLYAKAVITDWEKVIDDQGEGAKFTSENVLAFLQALPDWVFDEVRAFATNPRNFVEDIIDEEETAGNLPTG